MPYITQDRRNELESIIKEMKNKNVKANGDLNYILYCFCIKNVEPSYNNYKNYLGELTETVAEIRRRLLADYEDKAIERNGDII
jgi:hypothetical protein